MIDRLCIVRVTVRLRRMVLFFVDYQRAFMKFVVGINVCGIIIMLNQRKMQFIPSKCTHYRVYAWRGNQYKGINITHAGKLKHII